MINRVVLVGRLTKDVQVRKTQSNLSVASFTIAVDRRPSQGQQQGQQSADFINCVAWRQAAEFLGSYARKGALVGVEGRIQSRSYDDKDGRKVYVTEVVCDNVQLLESKSVSQARQSSGDQPNYDSMNQSTSYDSMNQGSAMSDNTDLNTGPSLDISSDDLPF